MDNKYICQFINSKDIRNYLIDTGYGFSVAEYAFLIWQCGRLSIDMRHNEWLKLKETTEDCILRTANCREGWSLHKAIEEYISFENLIIDTLRRSDNRSFYTGQWLDEPYNSHDYGWRGDNSYFDTYDLAYSYAKKYASEEPKSQFKVSKKHIDNSTRQSGVIEASFSKDGEMMSIDYYGNTDGFWEEYDTDIWCSRFDDLWFDIPIPFKPGDIVCDCKDKKPFVITTTVPWYRKEHPPKHNKDNLHLTYLDMTASGYSLDKEPLAVRYNWLSYPYLDLEYYIGDLGGDNRILYAYSLFKQDKINGDTLTKLVQLITAESMADRYYKDIDWEIDKETSKLLGIDKYMEERKHE